MKIQSPAVLTAHKNETLQTRVRPIEHSFNHNKHKLTKFVFINLNKIQSTAVPPDCTQNETLQTRVQLIEHSFNHNEHKLTKFVFINLNKIQSPAEPPDCTQK